VKAALLACVLASGSCAQHPAYSIGVATGAMGFGACEIDEVKVGDCAIVGAATGLFFGILTAVLYHFTDPNAHVLKLDDETVGSGGELHLHTFTPPPPVPLAVDAGVPMPDAVEAPPPDAAAQPALPDAAAP